MVSATKMEMGTELNEVSRSSSALWCLRLMELEFNTKTPFLGALLLCGVCDEPEEEADRVRVSRSSSALWCLRRRPAETLFPSGF